MACGSCGTGGGCGSGGGCSTGTSSGGCGGCSTKSCPSLHAFDWLAGMGGRAPAQTFDLIEIQFKAGRKAFYRNTGAFDLIPGDLVVVEADRGSDVGAVHLTGEMARLRARTHEIDAHADLPAILRRATPAEDDALARQRDDENEAFAFCRDRVRALDLAMKLVDAEWQSDRRKVTFFFTAEQRVDFRALVRELAGAFRTRVELRQIGARDETARLGGIGSCGRELCCSSWLTEFKPVTTGAARAQNLPLNPTRLSGQCGRLKCCLNYELEQYMAALKRFPRVDSAVQTEQGPGRVGKLDIFRDRVWIELESGSWLDLAIDDALPLVQPRRVSRPEPRGPERPRGEA